MTAALVVVDMQHMFADADSPWGAPRFSEIVAPVRRLAENFGERTVFTRWVAPTVPRGAWVDYFETYPFALTAPEHPQFDLVPGIGVGPGSSGSPGRRVVTRTTFGKWGVELEQALGGGVDLVVAGVSTDCCVLSTVLAAADAGRRVRVVADACAGASDADHERALAAMALYAPLVEITTADAVLADS